MPARPVLTVSTPARSAAKATVTVTGTGSASTELSRSRSATAPARTCRSRSSRSVGSGTAVRAAPTWRSRVVKRAVAVPASVAMCSPAPPSTSTTTRLSTRTSACRTPCAPARSGSAPTSPVRSDSTCVGAARTVTRSCRKGCRGWGIGAGSSGRSGPGRGTPPGLPRRRAGPHRGTAGPTGGGPSTRWGRRPTRGRIVRRVLPSFAAELADRGRHRRRPGAAAGHQAPVRPLPVERRAPPGQERGAAAARGGGADRRRGWTWTTCASRWRSPARGSSTSGCKSAVLARPG